MWNPMTYDEQTQAYLRLIEDSLDALLRREASSEVLDAMRYSLLGGGKRVRGILTLASCELVCGESMPALHAAMAVEMIHCYSLIHDDLPAMDDDDLRRGKPSCHVQFGEATAILAGDALLTLAFRQLCEIGDPPVAMQCVRILSDAAGHDGMILGQELDLLSEGMTLTPDQVTRLQSLKTGALLRAPVLMGSAVSGASKEQEQALVTYADCLGITFQIIDDILDVTADTAVLGKPAGSDIKSGKATSASTLGIDASRKLACEMTARGIEALNAAFDDARYLQEFAEKLLNREK